MASRPQVLERNLGKLSRCMRTVIACLAALVSLSSQTALAATSTSLVTLNTRPGVTQKFVLIKPDQPVASVILFSGGPGVLSLSQGADGIPVIGAATRSFLVMTRQEYVDHGFMVALVDVPSTHPNGFGLFRGSAEHAQDIAAVVAYMRQQVDLPVWLVGHSSGSQSAANIAVRLAQGIAGMVLTSSVTVANETRSGVLNMNLESIRVPAFVMAHEQDQCEFTPPADAQRIYNRLTGSPARLLTMLTGGLTARDGPCESRSPHGFFGIESQAAGAIFAFINANLSFALPNFTALWWNPAESGWGINFNHQGDILFGTLFTYDAAGAPLWLVMSAGAIQADGVTFSGALYRTTGPAFNAVPFTPITAANLTTVGSMSVTFSGANAATLNYTVNGTPVTKLIQRQVYGSRAANCVPTAGSRTSLANYQDLWWKADESGWGVNITHQDQTLFATIFTYDTNGRGLWLVMSAGARQADGSYLGDLYQTSGPAFNAQPFAPIAAANLTKVGTMQLRFSDGNTGTLAYTMNGVSVSKPITRQVFSSPVPSCTS